jgi:hypothetical protein
MFIGMMQRVYFSTFFSQYASLSMNIRATAECYMERGGGKIPRGHCISLHFWSTFRLFYSLAVVV